MVIYGAILVILPLRYELLAFSAAITTSFLLQVFPSRLTSSLVCLHRNGSLLAVLTVAIFAFNDSLGRQRVFEVRWLEE